MLPPAEEHLGHWKLKLQEPLPLERKWLQPQGTSVPMTVWGFLHEFVRFLLWPPQEVVYDKSCKKNSDSE